MLNNYINFKSLSGNVLNCSDDITLLLKSKIPLYKQNELILDGSRIDSDRTALDEGDKILLDKIRVELE